LIAIHIFHKNIHFYHTARFSYGINPGD